MTAAINVAGASTLIAGNIKKGINLFNVVGTYDLASVPSGSIYLTGADFFSGLTTANLYAYGYWQRMTIYVGSYWSDWVYSGSTAYALSLAVTVSGTKITVTSNTSHCTGTTSSSGNCGDYIALTYTGKKWILDYYESAGFTYVQHVTGVTTSGWSWWGYKNQTSEMGWSGPDTGVSVSRVGGRINGVSLTADWSWGGSSGNTKRREWLASVKNDGTGPYAAFIQNYYFTALHTVTIDWSTYKIRLWKSYDDWVNAGKPKT